MKLTEAIVEAVSPNCECGRARMPIHCRLCGYRTIYSKDANSATFDLEEVKDIKAQGFRCRRCGADFNEATPCSAPVRVAPALIGEVFEPEVGGVVVTPPIPTTPEAQAERQEQLTNLADLLTSSPDRREALRRLFAFAEENKATLVQPESHS